MLMVEYFASTTTGSHGWAVVNGGADPMET